MIFTKPARPVSRVFLHCSASDNPLHDCISAIRGWHVDGNGWRDVGYHYFIQSDGTIQQGRDLELIPAAQVGHNTGSIAICLHGLTESRFTGAQRNALFNLCQRIDHTYRTPRASALAQYAWEQTVTFHGHCEVSNKTCPVFDYKEWLSLDDKGRFNGVFSAPVEELVVTTPPPPTNDNVRPTLAEAIRPLFNWLRSL